jgi:YbbR domain-containing protein
MTKKAKNLFNFDLSENASYILVALFVSLILWVTLLSRKETRLVKDVTLEVIVANNDYALEEMPQSVKVEVVGPRILVRRFAQADDMISIDLGHVVPGLRRIKVPTDGLNLPARVVLRSINPHIINVRVVDPKGRKGEEND